MYVLMHVVEEVEEPESQLTVEEARQIKEGAEVGETLEFEATPANAGRIAAQTAKQVVMQRLREAERDLVFAEYDGKEGEVVSAVVQRLEGRSIIMDLGRAEAIMPPQEQAAGERYRNGQRFKVCILEVGKTPKGPQIVVSRAHKELLRKLFELEVPEIYNGVVEVRSIAREAGFRSKVAVAALQERVDAVGACVGLRGMRIQNIVNELHGEKIDVVEWVSDPRAFIAKALGPAQVMQVLLNEPEHIAIAVVPDRQLSLAIGREGQNARLAARLSGWRIDIRSTTEAEAEKLEAVAAVTRTAVPAEVLERAAAAAKEVAAPAPLRLEPAVAASEEAGLGGGGSRRWRKRRRWNLSRQPRRARSRSWRRRRRRRIEAEEAPLGLEPAAEEAVQVAEVERKRKRRRRPWRRRWRRRRPGGCRRRRCRTGRRSGSPRIFWSTVEGVGEEGEVGTMTGGGRRGRRGGRRGRRGVLGRRLVLRRGDSGAGEGKGCRAGVRRSGGGGGMSPSGAAWSAAGRGRSGGWCGWCGRGRAGAGGPDGEAVWAWGVYLSGGGGGV